MGWYLDLGVEAGVGLRVVSNATSFNGIVAFAPLLTTADACNPPAPAASLPSISPMAASALVPAVAYQVFPSSVTDLRFVSVDGKARLVAGDVEGRLTRVRFRPPASVALRLLNWREVPTVD